MVHFGFPRNTQRRHHLDLFSFYQRNKVLLYESYLINYFLPSIFLNSVYTYYVQFCSYDRFWHLWYFSSSITANMGACSYPIKITNNSQLNTCIDYFLLYGRKILTKFGNFSVSFIPSFINTNKTNKILSRGCVCLTVIMLHSKR